MVRHSMLEHGRSNEVEAVKVVEVVLLDENFSSPLVALLLSDGSALVITTSSLLHYKNGQHGWHFKRFDVKRVRL